MVGGRGWRRATACYLPKKQNQKKTGNSSVLHWSSVFVPVPHHETLSTLSPFHFDSIRLDSINIQPHPQSPGSSPLTPLSRSLSLHSAGSLTPLARCSPTRLELPGQKWSDGEKGQKSKLKRVYPFFIKHNIIFSLKTAKSETVLVGTSLGSKMQQ